MAKAAGIDSFYRKFAITRWKAKKLGIGGTLTVEEWHSMLDEYNGCYFCGSQGRMTMEHMMPKSIGGGFTAQNIKPVCLPCNLARGATFNASIPLFLTIEFWRPQDYQRE
jgi:hypothetical protein